MKEGSQKIEGVRRWNVECTGDEGGGEGNESALNIGVD